MRFLRDKIADSLQVTAASASNTTFNEDFNLFIQAFDNLISKMNHINPQETLSRSEADTNNFLRSLILNRGDALQSRFKSGVTKHACFEDQISRLTKTVIEQIEDKQINHPLLARYRERGVYEMLYHIGTLGFASLFHDDQLKLEMRSAIIGLSCSSLSIAFFSSMVFLEFNNQWVTDLSTALLGSAMVYMSVLLYGITSDILAARLNLPYFLLGHRPSQAGLCISNDPVVQAIVWGVCTTKHGAKIASGVFGIAIFAALAASSPVNTFMLPLTAIAVLLFVLCANVYANYSVKQYLKNGVSMSMLRDLTKRNLREIFELTVHEESIPLEKIDFDHSGMRQWVTKHDVLNNDQLNGLALMLSSNKDKAGWFANTDRKMIGTIGMPLIAIISLVLMLSLKCDSNFLLSTILPIIAACVEITALTAAVTYASANQEKQIDNRYRLFKGDPDHNAPDMLYISSGNITMEV